MQIKRKYIIDDKNRKTAVLLDIKTFNQIEEIIENYALANLIKEEETNTAGLELQEARAYYGNLKK